SPVLCVLTALFIVELASLRLKPAASRLTSILAASAFVFAGSPEWSWTHVENTHPFYKAVRGAAQFLTREKKNTPEGIPDRAIVSHWDYGHWLLYYAEIPVVAHPFQDFTAPEALSFFCSTDPDALDSYSKRTPVRYLLLETPTGR